MNIKQWTKFNFSEVAMYNKYNKLVCESLSIVAMMETELEVIYDANIL